MNSQANFSPSFVQPSNSTPCKSEGKLSSWKSQFACPHGKFGWLIGQLMALKNAKMNRFALEMLDVQPKDQILEIGFGPGRLIKMISELAPKGFIAGIDISEVMVQQATKHNKRLIETGHIELSLASIANIPYEFARFDKVLAVNNYQFWPNAEHNLTEIQRVLNENGLLVLCLRMNEPKEVFQLAPGFTEQEVEEIVGLVRWVGFRDVQMIKLRVGREATCLIARK